MFRDRLYWNRHYTQKLQDWPGWTDRAVNPVFRRLNWDRRDDDLIAAWKAGETGYPMVDASMRCLRATGWLNFRMRAMCASFFGYVLEQPWRVGADHFYEHLIDADPAINYTQWQYQTGLTGIAAVRVYNPRKQVRENDPDGEFVHRWVPELADVPPRHLDEPEKMPLATQAEPASGSARTTRGRSSSSRPSGRRRATGSERSRTVRRRPRGTRRSGGASRCRGTVASDWRKTTAATTTPAADRPASTRSSDSRPRSHARERPQRSRGWPASNSTCIRACTLDHSASLWRTRATTPRCPSGADSARSADRSASPTRVSRTPIHLPRRY
ncbi:FAD-binding domain-containing protein [Halobaculum litoreum]|uniref:FAD-binding domain-containing protein n=1 Tax=Halobaculum litoreum TaxID=3031998 RepID=A0ABD5XSL4_9EURY